MGLSTAAPDLHGLATFIRERREVLGLTQAQLAEQILWEQERISNLERAKYGLPSLPLLSHLADALHVPLSDILQSLGYSDVGSTAVRRLEAESSHFAALLYCLERLLGIKEIHLRQILDTASGIVADAMGADVVEVFLYQPEADSLKPVGTSLAEHATRRKIPVIDSLPLTHSGRIIDVLRSGEPFVTGSAETDSIVQRRLWGDLAIQSLAAARIEIRDTPQGVLVALSTLADKFSEDDLHFFLAVADWVGLVAHRSALLYTQT